MDTELWAQRCLTAADRGGASLRHPSRGPSVLAAGGRAGSRGMLFLSWGSLAAVPPGCTGQVLPSGPTLCRLPGRQPGSAVSPLDDPAGPPGFLLVCRSPFALHPARKPPGDTITPPVSSQKAFRLRHPAPWTPSCAVGPVGWSSPPEGRAGWPRSGRAPSLGGLYQALWEKGPERRDSLSPSPAPPGPGHMLGWCWPRPGGAA